MPPHSSGLVPLHLLLLLLLGAASPPPASAALVCLRGAYLSGAYCVLCPSGTFGNRAGLTSPQCSGPCAPGHFCPPGSTSATEKVCGAAAYYCPRGSAMRIRVDPGYYTVAFPLDPSEPSSMDRADSQTPCEPGFFCVDGIRRDCPAGSCGSSSGLSTAACSGPCPRGFYCPEGTADPVACPAGTFGAALALQTPACSGRCPIGHYCEAATVTPRSCPAGSFGGSQGLTTKQCSSQCSDTTCLPSKCPAGFYCPLAATSPVPCGDVSVFCPEGSASPTSVSVGFYTTWKRAFGGDGRGGRLEDVDVDGGALAVLNQTTRSDQLPCERGTYCGGGVKRWCPAGTYGDAQGLSAAQCTGLCPAGFYCPTGTADYYEFPCTARTVFCRQGSALPTPVSTGYFTVTASTGDTRVDQTVCPPGSYCTGGVKYQCPAGTYGAMSGLATPTCSGRCQDGYVCAPGSTSATQAPCPAGQYSRNGVFCAPCLPGYWCTAGSPDPMQNTCGTDAAFCPLGSSGPTGVTVGYYAAGQTLVTHSTQALCVVQTLQHLPQCPSRTIGTNSGV